MTNEEQKLREIAYKHAEPKVIWNDGNMSICPDEEKIESLLSDLTALIEEHYYPKEFVEWMLRCSAYSDVPFREFTLKWNVNIGPDEWRCFTTDELFNYWVNNKK